MEPGTSLQRSAATATSGGLGIEGRLETVITARTALAELEGVAELLPNQGMLINTLPLLEARASLEIENIVTSTDRLFHYRNFGDQADAATKEALRYGQALPEGFRSLAEHPLSTRTAEDVCSKLKGMEMRVRRVPCAALVSNWSPSGCWRRCSLDARSSSSIPS